MRRLNFLDDAKSNLADIAAKIEADSGSAEVAQRFTGRIIEQCERLARLPGLLGRARPELMPEIRSHPFGRYVIFFRTGTDRLDVVNVLHARRDLRAYFRERRKTGR